MAVSAVNYRIRRHRGILLFPSATFCGREEMDQHQKEFVSVAHGLIVTLTTIGMRSYFLCKVSYISP